MGISEFIATTITAFIDHTGYISVVLLMTMESMVFPIPSEAVMPFAGFLVASGRFSLMGVILASSLGSLIGSLLSYAMGRFGGDIFVARYGKWFLLSKHDLEATKQFFSRYGQWTVLASRFIPVVRHLISIPAGAGRMNLWVFCIFTIIGSTLWNTFLVVVGMVLRDNWSRILHYGHTIDKVIVVLLGMAVLFFIYTHLKRQRG
ncbi:MAG: DedA family protein [Candidatus Margulisiibacteriota bacterium]